MSGLKIFTGNANPELAKKVATAAGVELGYSEVGHFADGEVGFAHIAQHQRLVTAKQQADGRGAGEHRCDQRRQRVGEWR